MYANDMSLSLKSETFSALKEDFDSILARTIGNMEMKGAEEATVTLKLGISLEKGSVNGPAGIRDIVKPSFKHDISSVMQVKDKKSGALTGDYEMVWDADEGKYVMRRIDNGQTSMFDEDCGGTVIDAEYTDAEYTALPEGQRGLPEGSLEDEDLEDADDTAGDENADTDSARESDKGSESGPTSFEWLKQFVGQELRVTEAMGNYTVRTGDNKVVLSSAAEKSAPFYCPAEKLEGHVGHKVSCIGYGDSDGVIANVSIECGDCNEILFSLDDDGVEEVESEEKCDSVERNYEYDMPENKEEGE